MDQRRLILFLVFSFALVMLWDGWLKHNQPPVAAQQAATAGAAAPADGAVPTPTLTAPAAGAPVVPGEQAAASAAAPRVVTDLNWLALLAGMVVTMKTYWIALKWRSGVRKTD